MRIQSLAIHNPGSTPQFYISCAQVNVTGGSGSKEPGPLVKIPGAFKATDPGYTANVSFCLPLTVKVRAGRKKKLTGDGRSITISSRTSFLALQCLLARTEPGLCETWVYGPAGSSRDEGRMRMRKVRIKERVSSLEKMQVEHHCEHI